MKKVLIFSVAYIPSIGGAEIAVREITNRLNDDISFDMITLNLDNKDEREETVGNVRVHRIGGGTRIHKLLYPFAAYYLATRLHTKEKYDGVWSIMASFSGFAALFFKIRFPHMPFVLTLQEGDPISYIKRQARIVYPLFLHIFRQADIIQAISQYLKDFARDMGAKKDIEVIPNGVDVSLFTKKIPDAEKNNLRKKLGLSTYDRVIITTSRLVIKNAVDVIIKSLLYSDQTVKLLILGEGNVREELMRLVEENGLESRVYFLGTISYEKIPEYLAIADVFVRPSRSEGMGNSFIEAMAAGIPVIATNVGGIPDFLKDRETGLFCKIDNPRDVADKVKEILTNTELRTKIIDNGKRLAKESYDWEYIAKEIKTRVFDPVLS